MLGKGTPTAHGRGTKSLSRRQQTSEVTIRGRDRMADDTLDFFYFFSCCSFLVALRQNLKVQPRNSPDPPLSGCRGQEPEGLLP